jgi:hypothetical protein
MSAGFTEQSIKETILKGIALIRGKVLSEINFIHKLFGLTMYN